jgi:hypothetical protein
MLAATQRQIVQGSPSAAGIDDASLTFPTTPIGGTSGMCKALCFVSNPSSGTCDRSGTETLVHDLSSPFSAFNYRVAPYDNGAIDCEAGVPVNLPAFVGVKQQLTFNLEFSPTSRGTFSDFLTLFDFTFNLTGSTPNGTSDLVPYKPNGWSAPVVVSDTPGTQQDSPALKSTEPLYVSWAVLNAGDLSVTSRFYIDLLLDGSFAGRWVDNNSLDPNFFIDVTDFKIGPLAPGSHSLELIPDSTHTTLGSAENYTKTFTVIQLGPPPPPQQPTTSTSWYVRATGPYQKDSALYAWANKVGQQAGNLNKSNGGANFVILNFGQPVQLSDGSYGAAGFGRKVYATEIANTAEQFIIGYESVAHHVLFLAIGTSNNQASGTKQPNVTPAHGQAWAQMLITLNDWIVSEGFRVHLSSASDAELGFNSPAATQAWVQSFTDEIAASGLSIPTYDFGDAAGCPQTPATSKAQPCPVKDSPYHWTQGDIAGLGALFVPEIYTKCMAMEWEEISQYIALSAGTTGLIKGVLSEYGACAQVGGCGGIACKKTDKGPRGTHNTPAEAWQDMVTALGGSPTTAAGLSSLLWSTDIKYSY